MSRHTPRYFRSLSKLLKKKKRKRTRSIVQCTYPRQQYYWNCYTTSYTSVLVAHRYTQVHTHTRWCLLYSVPGSTNRVSPARLILYPGIPDDPFRTSIYLFSFFFSIPLLLHSYGSHIYCIIVRDGVRFPIVRWVCNHISGFGRKLDPTSRFRLQTVNCLMTGIIVP